MELCIIQYALSEYDEKTLLVHIVLITKKFQEKHLYFAGQNYKTTTYTF